MEEAGKLVLNMLTDKNISINFVTVKPDDSKIDKAFSTLAVDLNIFYPIYKDHCRGVLDKLIFSIKKYPNDVMKYFADIAAEGCVIPYDFFTDFELKRFEFSYFGTFK